MTKVCFLLLIFSMAAQANNWDRKNDPSNFDDHYQYHLSTLPLKAQLPLTKMPWSSSFWPRKKGSVNYRWNTENPIGFKLNSPNRQQVNGMSLDELARLSPAEKFDLAHGRYDYPFSQAVERGSKPSAKDFEGLCDGWTAAAIQFTEPAPVNFTNPDGIVIPFGSSDVKALMSYDISINMTSAQIGSTFVGSYCAIPGGMLLGGPSCVDINPGAFHVVVANQIGLKQESFGVDIDPGRETWNHPVFGYEFEILGRAKLRQGVAQAWNVRAKLYYAQDVLNEDVPGKIFSWLPTTGTEDYAYSVMDLEYVLELDSAGRITGGSWLGSSKRHHPDLFWMPTNQIEWTQSFKILDQLYRPAF
jgi:hypothetical protein